MKKIILPLAAIASAGTAQDQNTQPRTAGSISADAQVLAGDGSENANTDLGAQVGTTAKKERDAADKGVGGDVSTMAKTRNSNSADTRAVEKAGPKADAAAQRRERTAKLTADQVRDGTQQTLDDVSMSRSMDTAISGHETLGGNISDTGSGPGGTVGCSAMDNARGGLGGIIRN